MNAVVRLPVCPHCNTVLNAGLICADCGVVEAQIDIDAQNTIEHQPGAVRFTRPDVPNPSRRFRSDGKWQSSRQ